MDMGKYFALQTLEIVVRFHMLFRDLSRVK